MRRTGHIRERSPGSFELRYTLGAEPATRKRRTATATVRGSRKNAERELRRLLCALDAGEHVDRRRMTVRQWLTTWLDATQQQVAPHGQALCRDCQRLHRSSPGQAPAHQLAPVHIQEAHNTWATDGGRRDGKPGGLSPRTRRHIHRILSAALARVVEQQIVARNACDAFKKRLPKVERREMTALTAEQSARFARRGTLAFIGRR